MVAFERQLLFFPTESTGVLIQDILQYQIHLWEIAVVPDTRNYLDTRKSCPNESEDMEEYIEGLIAVAVPLDTCRQDLQAAIWAVGLKQEFHHDVMKRFTQFLLGIAEEINYRFCLAAGAFNSVKETSN